MSGWSFLGLGVLLFGGFLSIAFVHSYLQSRRLRPLFGRVADRLSASGLPSRLRTSSTWLRSQVEFESQGRIGVLAYLSIPRRNAGPEYKTQVSFDLGGLAFTPFGLRPPGEVVNYSGVELPRLQQFLERTLTDNHEAVEIGDEWFDERLLLFSEDPERMRAFLSPTVRRQMRDLSEITGATSVASESASIMISAADRKGVGKLSLGSTFQIELPGWLEEEGLHRFVLLGSQVFKGYLRAHTSSAPVSLRKPQRRST